VAEPPQQAALDDMEELQRTLENVGHARGQRGGNIFDVQYCANRPNLHE
jgi:hypothetical protein